MSRYNDMSEEDRRREERREYHNDVFYQVWRSGRNADAINYDRVDDHHWRGDSSDTAASHEIRIQQERQQRRRLEEDLLEQEYYQQQEEQEPPTCA